MTEPLIIASWRKNSRETLMVKLDTFKGASILDLRTWYEGGGGQLRPGRSGLTIAIRHLPRLSQALCEALATASASGLLEGLE